MAGRPGWYYDHPPACTCVSCVGDSGRQPPQPAGTTTDMWDENGIEPGGSGGRWFTWLLVIAAALVLGVVVFASMEEDGKGTSGTASSPPTRVPAATSPPLAAAPSPTPRPALAATSTASPSQPNLRHVQHKSYMLEAINAERARAGRDALALGDNVAAQLHAEASLEHCFSSHWGIDGLKPYMRYTLAGGYQANGENVHGSDYCIKASDRYYPLSRIEEEIEEAMEGLMQSPGHRRTILLPAYKKVNIGLAWDRYNISIVQLFEGDHVEYTQLPAIEDGTLSMSGTVKNGVRFEDEEELGVQVFYDPPPHALSLGQVARTYCYSSGLQIAALRPPLRGSWYYLDDVATQTYKPCPDPYRVPADAPAPSSDDEAHALWQAAYSASQTLPEVTITLPWITANEWTAEREAFSVRADLTDVLGEHGHGVYTIVLWAPIDGEDTVISEYSLFYGVTPIAQ